MAREKRFQTYPHRYGYGNVHRYIYDPTNKVWHCLCRSPDRGDPHGKQVADGTPVTCRICGHESDELPILI